MRGDAMRLTERIKKRRADFWAALGDDGNNGIEELLKLYWWWGSDTADFFFDVKEEHQAHGRKSPRADRPSAQLARDHRARRHVEPRASRVGQLLQCRHHQQSLSRARQLHGCAVAPVATIQAQGQAT